MFDNKPPLNSKANTANGVLKASYCKLQPQKIEPFQIVNVQLHTVVLDEEEVPNTVSIYKFTAASRFEKELSRNGTDAGVSSEQNTHDATKRNEINGIQCW